LIIIAFFTLNAKAEVNGTMPSSAPVPLPRPADAARPANIPSSPAEPRGASGRIIGGRATYRALLEHEAKLNGLPPDVADAVTAIESGYDPSAIGGVGEIGLMQVRPETAAMLGFRGGPGELAKPDVNIRYGVIYLAQAWRLTNGDLCRTLMKYRAGHGEEVMSALSAQYCGRARAHLASIGSPLTDGASVPFVYDRAIARRPRASRRGPPRIRTAATSRSFWAAHESRVRAITRQVEAKWRRIASR
jgi:hypothetical protein